MCRNVKSCSYHINLHKLNPVHMLSGSFPFSHFFLPWGAELLLCSCGYHRKQDVIQERACWMDSCNIFSKLQAVQLYDTSMCSSSRSGEPWNRKHDYWDYICTHTHTHQQTILVHCRAGAWHHGKKTFPFFTIITGIVCVSCREATIFLNKQLTFWGANCVNHAKWISAV